MELVDGSPIAHTRSNGATRQIVGTHRSRDRIPTLEEEPLWMRMATTAPAGGVCDVQGYTGVACAGPHDSPPPCRLGTFSALFCLLLSALSLDKRIFWLLLDAARLLQVK